MMIFLIGISIVFAQSLTELSEFGEVNFLDLFFFVFFFLFCADYLCFFKTKKDGQRVLEFASLANGQAVGVCSISKHTLYFLNMFKNEFIIIALFLF